MEKSWDDTEKYGDLLGALEHLRIIFPSFFGNVYAWLVVTGTMEFDDFPFSWECHFIPTDELTPSFFRGFQTTNQHGYLPMSVASTFAICITEISQYKA